MNPYSREHGEAKLQTIREIVLSGGTVRVPIWRLLGWFHCRHRGAKVDGAINRALKECELVTLPDFADRSLRLNRIIGFRQIPPSTGRPDSTSR